MNEVIVTISGSLTKLPITEVERIVSEAITPLTPEPCKVVVKYEPNDIDVVIYRRIIDAIYEAIEVKYRDYSSKTRKREYLFARLIFVHLCLSMSVATHDKIASFVGRHRTTVTRYEKIFDDEIKYNKNFRHKYESVCDVLSKNVSQ